MSTFFTVMGVLSILLAGAAFGLGGPTASAIFLLAAAIFGVAAAIADRKG